MCPWLKMKTLHRRALMELVELSQQKGIFESFDESKLIPRCTKHTD
jgi:hypothetical protein